MPKRQNVRRVNSEPVQGDDSYVVLNSITWRRGRDIENGWAEWTDAERIGALAPVIAGWNWVDDNGEPLPQVKDNPSVILDLTMDELLFILKALAGDKPKN
jgi:hypothetical protein